MVIEVIDVEVVGDDLFAAPARRAGGQVGFAVTIGVEGLLDFGAFEVVDRLDAELFNMLFRYQVALHAASLGDIADEVDLLVGAIRHLCIVHREPAVGPVVDIAEHDRLVEERVLQLFRLLDIIAEFLQAGANQGFLEIAGVPGGAGRLNRDPFTRLGNSLLGRGLLLFRRFGFTLAADSQCQHKSQQNNGKSFHFYLLFFG